MSFNVNLNRTFHEIRVQYSLLPIERRTNIPIQGVTKGWRDIAVNKNVFNKAYRNQIGYIVPHPFVDQSLGTFNTTASEAGTNLATIIGEKPVPAKSFVSLITASAPEETDVATHNLITVAADAVLSFAAKSLVATGDPSSYVNLLETPVDIEAGKFYHFSSSSDRQLGNFIAYFYVGQEQFALKKMGASCTLYQDIEDAWVIAAKSESVLEHMHSVGADKSIRRLVFTFDDQAPYDITGNLGSFSAFVLESSNTGDDSVAADSIRSRREGLMQKMATPLFARETTQNARITLTALEVDPNDYGIGLFVQRHAPNYTVNDDPITVAYPLYNGRLADSRTLTLDLHRTYLYDSDIVPEVSFDGGATYLPCTGSDNTFTVAVPSTATNTLQVRFIYTPVSTDAPVDRLISYSVYQYGEQTLETNTWTTLDNANIHEVTIKDVISRDMDSTAATVSYFDPCGELFILGAREWIAFRIQLRKAGEDWFTIFQGYSQGTKYEIVQEAGWGAESNLTPRMYTINLAHELVAYKQVFNRVLKHFFDTSRSAVEAYQSDASIISSFNSPDVPIHVKQAHTWKVVDVLAYIIAIMTGNPLATDFPDIPIRISVADDENNMMIDVGDNLLQKAETLIASYLPNFLYKDFETGKFKLGTENRLTTTTPVGNVFFYNPAALNGAYCTWPGAEICSIVADNNSYRAFPVAPKYNVVQVTGSAGLRTSGTLTKYSAVVYNPKSVQIADDQAVLPDPNSIDYIGWPVEMVEYNTGFALLSKDNIEFRALHYLEYKGIGRKHVSFSGPVIVKAHETESGKYCLPRHFDMLTLNIWTDSGVLERQVYINSADLTWTKGYIRMEYNVVEARI